MLTQEQKDGLGVALNEAEWLGIAGNAEAHLVAISLRVLALPADELPPVESAIVTLSLSGVSRIAASLRDGRWDDEEADVVGLDLAELPNTVSSFGGMPIYGWTFVDPPENEWVHWSNRLSLDVTLSGAANAHVIDLFQEGGSGRPRHLDLRVWFAELKVLDGDLRQVPLDEFIASGVRWWDGLYSRDPRTSGHGIIPLTPENRTE